MKEAKQVVIDLNEIEEVDKLRIKKIHRNGYYVNVLERDFLNKTYQLVVICNKLHEVITAFPGVYAPAFPTQLMDKEEVKASILFWENHAFIKKSLLQI
jgi:hypothetical protein